MVPDSLPQVIQRIRSGRAILPLARAADLSDSRWHQIEDGSVPPAETLWRMADALDATAEQRGELFRAAGYEDLYNGLTRIGSRGRPDIPTSARAGVLADPTLSREDKERILEFIEGREALARQRADNEAQQAR